MPTKKPLPGDDLLRIAQKEGVSYQDIRNHPDNSELFSGRTPVVLSEADEIFIPERKPKQFPVAIGDTHYLVHRPAKRLLHLVLHDDNGALRQIDYTLSDFKYDGKKPEHGPFPDKLYGFAYQGVVHEQLPAALTQLTLTLEDAPDDPIEIHLGRLDPISTTRGLKVRLQALGLYHGDVEDAAYDSDLSDAVRFFQRQQGLAVSGAADRETRAQLETIYGG
jgi:hypothetical protein